MCTIKIIHIPSLFRIIMVILLIMVTSRSRESALNWNVSFSSKPSIDNITIDMHFRDPAPPRVVPLMNKSVVLKAS